MLNIPTKHSGDLLEAQEFNQVVDSLKSLNIGLRGRFPTYVALKAEFPSGTTGVYLVDEDGHWYYYSDGDWQDGGLYQAPLNISQSKGTSTTRAMSEKAVTDELDFLDGKIDGAVSGYIGAIAHNAAAPTPGKSGYYEFSSAGSCAWITGGAVTVAIGDRVSVVFDDPDYTYVYVGQSDKVSTNVQSLTEGQKMQARENIGGASHEDMLVKLSEKTDKSFNGGIFNGLEYQLITSPTGRVWLDRNLGATKVASSINDSASYGHLYQWGRLADGHQIRTSVTTATQSNIDVPQTDEFILSSGDWRNPKNDNLWQGVNGVNLPCPEGFRLPTEEELNAERIAWSTNNSAGAFASALKFPAAGERNRTDGAVNFAGSFGCYWTSSINGINSRQLLFGVSEGGFSNAPRATGCSVRLIRDESFPTLREMGIEAVANKEETLTNTPGNYPASTAMVAEFEKVNELIGQSLALSLLQSEESFAGFENIKHAELLERDAQDAHPISSITGLQEELDKKHNDFADRDAEDAHPISSVSNLTDSLVDAAPISLIRASKSGTNLGILVAGGVGNLKMKINDGAWIDAETHKDGKEFYKKFTSIPDFISVYVKDSLGQEQLVYSNQESGKVVFRDELWMVVYDDNKLKRSSDDGVTFDEEIDVSSIATTVTSIKSVYVFITGDLLIFRGNSCYYSKDWDTLSESVLIDELGSPWNYELNGYPAFSQFLSAKKHRPVIEHEGDEIEILMFATYGTPTNLWYTINGGETIQCVYRFRNIRTGIYPANPGVGINNYTILHVHSVDFNPADNSHYVQTGDHRIWDAERGEYINECFVLKFTYNPVTDSWADSVIGNGFEYKWCNAIFDANTVYWSWDYNPGGGVMKSLISELSDISKHERVLEIENDCICVVANDTEMIATILFPGSPMPNKNFYYTPNYKTSEPVWHLIEGEIPLSDYDYNRNGWWNLSQPIHGRIIASFMSLFKSGSPAEFLPELSPLLPSTDLVSFIKKQGFQNAFSN